MNICEKKMKAFDASFLLVKKSTGSQVNREKSSFTTIKNVFPPNDGTGLGPIRSTKSLLVLEISRYWTSVTGMFWPLNSCLVLQFVLSSCNSIFKDLAVSFNKLALASP